MARRTNWPRQISTDRFLADSPYLALARLLLVSLILAVFMYLGRLAFEPVDTQAVSESWRAEWAAAKAAANEFGKLYYSFLEATPEPLLRAQAFLTTGRFMRFLFLPLAALIGALMLGGLYVQQTYRLPSFWYGLRYMLAALFGIGYFRLVVSEGRKVLQPGEINLVDIIGGPGFVLARPGNAVLLEKLRGPARVEGAGASFLTRPETLKEVVSLDEQHGFIESISATTKDGIEVVIRDVHFRYRLLPGRRPEAYPRGLPADPYPFSRQAAHNMAYQRVVGSGGLTPWKNSVQLSVQSTLTEYVSAHKFNDLTAPGFLRARILGEPPNRSVPDPRLEVAQRLQSKPLRERLRSVGAELLWFDIGHFDVANPVVDQKRIEAWGAKWSGIAGVQRAYGQAYLEAQRELGRAEAQAALLARMVSGFSQQNLVQNTKENIRKLILLRTAQVLEAMNERGTPPALRSPSGPREPDKP